MEGPWELQKIQLPQVTERRGSQNWNTLIGWLPCSASPGQVNTVRSTGAESPQPSNKLWLVFQLLEMKLAHGMPMGSHLSGLLPFPGPLPISNSRFQSWVLIRICKTSKVSLQMSPLHNCLPGSHPRFAYWIFLGSFLPSNPTSHPSWVLESIMLMSAFPSISSPCCICFHHMYAEHTG